MRTLLHQVLYKLVLVNGRRSEAGKLTVGLIESNVCWFSDERYVRADCL